jgi:hypothetical protein
MTHESCSRFASSAWWDEHKLTNPAIVQAILALSTDARPAETIWQAPTGDEWQKVARLVIEYGDYGDDPVLDGDQFTWALLWGLSGKSLRPWTTHRGHWHHMSGKLHEQKSKIR